MRAVITEKYGAEEELQIGEVPKPEPRANQILVKIDACSVNPIDWKLLRGDFKIVMSAGGDNDWD